MQYIALFLNIDNYWGGHPSIWGITHGGEYGLCRVIVQLQHLNLTADAILNESLTVQLPKLAVADKLLDAKFAKEVAAEFNMQEIINATKHSGVVYDNLAHFLCNEMVRAHNKSNTFYLLSPWTRLTIFGWLASGAALILVIML